VTGAEDALAVNNAAGALVLALNAHAAGREVLISRGELIEIGGSFRIPDILERSGARLREVGTTNRTHLADYRAGLGPGVAAILTVHRSNFEQRGFVTSPEPAELAGLAAEAGLPYLFDVGSGLLADLGPYGLAGEPRVADGLDAGATLVLFSGDKLLGGPQAGIIVGRKEHLARVRKHPLMRALRVDKITYAALEATLAEHLSGKATDSVPVVRMATTPVEAVAVRAEILAARARHAGFGAELVDGHSTIGGGSAAGSALPTKLVALTLTNVSADALESRLRALDPPVITRILDDRVVIDLRTVDPNDDGELASLLDGIVRRAEL